MATTCNRINCCCTGSTPGVIGIPPGSVPWFTIEANDRTSGKTKLKPGTEKLTYQEKMRIFLLQSNKPATPKDKSKISISPISGAFTVRNHLHCQAPCWLTFIPFHFIFLYSLLDLCEIINEARGRSDHDWLQFFYSWWLAEISSVDQVMHTWFQLPLLSITSFLSDGSRSLYLLFHQTLMRHNFLFSHF